MAEQSRAGYSASIRLGLFYVTLKGENLRGNYLWKWLQWKENVKERMVLTAMIYFLMREW